MIDRTLTTLTALLGTLHELAVALTKAGYLDLARQVDDIRAGLVKTAKDLGSDRPAA